MFDVLFDGEIVSREQSYANARAFALGFDPRCVIQSVPIVAVEQERDRRAKDCHSRDAILSSNDSWVS